MPTHIILIGLGAILVLTGVIGGGLSLKELKLPTINNFSRILACVFGVIFIFSGIYLEKTQYSAVGRDSKILEQERIAEEENLRKEQERIAEEEHLRKEQERIAEEERLRKEQERIAEEEHLRKEQERIAEEERLRKEQERIAEEERLRKERERLAEEERLRKERERLAEDERKRKEMEYSKRALVNPKQYHWTCPITVFNEQTGDNIAEGTLRFGPITSGNSVSYAEAKFNYVKTSKLYKSINFTVAAWGFMGSKTDSTLSFVDTSNANHQVLMIITNIVKRNDLGIMEIKGGFSFNDQGKGFRGAFIRLDGSCKAE